MNANGVSTFHPSLAMPARDRPQHILLVEDNPTSTLLVSEIFETLPGPSFALTTTTTLSQAISVLEEQDFDVALVDLELPDSTGLDTCRSIHAQAPHVPLVILTSSDAYDDAIQDVVNVGAQDYLVKGTFDAHTLIRVARYAVERQRASEALLRVERQLRQAKKMEALGIMAGGVTHHFSNILSHMFGYIELSMMNLNANNPAYSDLEQALAAGHCAKDLLTRILAFVHQTKNEHIRLKLQDVVSETLTLLRPTLPTTIDIHEHLHAENSMILAHAVEINEIITSLYANAEHAMRGTSGTLEIRLEPFEVINEFVAGHAELKPGPYIQLTIKDTGHGMTPDVVERIFDPFFTTKKVGDGVGMGLALVHGLMHSYGGAILVESGHQEGTTISCFFPEAKAVG